MQNVIPTLRMTSYEQTKRFYTEGLGFAIDWEHRFQPGFPVFMQVTRAGLTIYLSEHRGDCQPGGLVHLFVNDVDAWYQEWTGSVSRISTGLSKLNGPPTEEIPGLRMFTAVDPDGNQLRVATRTGGE